MHPPLPDWDAAYLDEIDRLDEGADLDKKQAEGLKQDEIAKQACAFANAGGGYVVFGIKDAKHGRGFDDGVPAHVGRGGREPVKAWIEALIPKLHEPPIVGCEARFIRRPAHAPDRGVLVLYIPTSENRPHWVKAGQETAFLRVGEHSAPMSRRTFLDMANRNVAPEVEIENLNIANRQDTKRPAKSYVLNPLIKLVSGPICDRWHFELEVPPEAGRFEASQAVLIGGTRLVLPGKELLYPGRSTMASGTYVTLILADPVRDKDKPLEAVLYTAGRPVRRTFHVRDLEQ
jgi:hypothetical protein